MNNLNKNVNYDLYESGQNMFRNALLLRENAYLTLDAQNKPKFTASNNFNCYLMPVEKNTDYVFTYVRFSFLFDDYALNPISGMINEVSKVNSGNAGFIAFSFNTSDNPLSEYFVGKFKKVNYLTQSISSDDVSDNTITLDFSDSISKKTLIAFTADITSFDKIIIKRTYGNTFTITSTQLKYQTSSTSTEVTYNHGLTIENNIQVIIKQLETNTCAVCITSNGHMYVLESMYFGLSNTGTFSVDMSNSVLTNAKLSKEICDIDKQTWVFGDSYVSIAEKRWPYYLVENGTINDILLNGHAGGNSQQSMVELKNLIKIGVPKRIVWCLGMNDGSDDGNTPNTAWRNYLRIVENLCDLYGIELILSAIPSVPSINNKGKNKYVRQDSGRRYVDFAKAVENPNYDPSTDDPIDMWYSGMLDPGTVSNPDYVHPTEYGARSLFNRIMVDVPEIGIGM